MALKSVKIEPVEVVFSFDTTGSMYPCLTQVRRYVKETVTRLFKDIPHLRIGIIAHGDYCDKGTTYVTKQLDLTDDVKKLIQFIERVEATGGGDAPECYELVLHEARSLSWTSGKNKVLVVIGDDVPHSPSDNPKRLDWKNEAGLLREAGVKVHAVQALGRSYATGFYDALADKTGGFKLNLDQFNQVTDLVMAVAYKQAGDDKLQSYEQEVKKSGRMSRNLSDIFDIMLNRKPTSKSKDKAPATKRDLDLVPSGRFQVLKVDDDQPIEAFVEEQGLDFERGRGFYEFTKTETVQKHKEVILMDRWSGDCYTGKKARELLGLPQKTDARISTDIFNKYSDKWIAFVQSTSNNRKLKNGTKFLYEVKDY